MDPDPDPAIFITDLQEANKKLIKKNFCILLFEGTVHLHHFSKMKVKKRSHKTVVIKVFITIFA